MSETERSLPPRPVAESLQAGRERRREAHGEWVQEAAHTLSLVLKVRARGRGLLTPARQRAEAQAARCPRSPAEHGYLL